ncbi:PIR Superfamily Protein [Plasmodium ovale curtisi]|uniref:PIR Superfamily Protein n=1 Tax=Plasmodium ovale curtisi TaxID=864141 RepID=A0A1A8WE46_PLAOA|nr:PIR Superfamily Protein [Plasmodium ovale curtisi]SBS98862.1 PIR Superfamily Protein [Plasmodium ovale curtisi]
MSSQPKSTPFLRLFYNSSKELISEKFYDAMNSESSDLSRYNDICNEMSVRSKNDEVNIICTKFLRYLENCKFWNDGNLGYDVSILLNYWLYVKLNNIYGANPAKDIVLAFSKLQYMWQYQQFFPKNQSYYPKCKPDLSIVEHHDWERRKKLYDYYVDFETLFTTARDFPNKCEDYYKKFEEKTSLYKYFVEQCSPDKNNCPKFYKKDNDYNPELVLPKLRCHDRIKAEREVAEEDAKPPILQHFPEKGLGSDPDPDPSGTELAKGNSQIGKKVGHSVLGVAPVLLTATALYRYTPVGAWIRKLGGINTNSISDIDGFPSYTRESEDMLLGDTENYISYQPM